jgi:Fe-S cluster biosynthesis and repair protein YggX
LSKKQLETQLELLKLFLPEILVEHFDLINSKTEEETLHLFFEEQNKPPVEHASKVLISKGFHDEITVQDFPLRGKKVFLHIKRRRWTEKQTNLIVQRDWNLVSKGSRMTEEFAAFLKEISRF